jgi:hypothetical protein
MDKVIEVGPTILEISYSNSGKLGRASVSIGSVPVEIRI